MSALDDYISKMGGILTKKSKKAELYKEALNFINNNPKLILNLINNVKGGLPKALISDILLKNIQAINAIVSSCNLDLVSRSGLSFLKLYRCLDRIGGSARELCNKDVRYTEHCLRFGSYSNLIEARKHFIKEIVSCKKFRELSLVTSLGNSVFNFELNSDAKNILASYPYILAIEDTTADLYFLGGYRISRYHLRSYPEIIKSGDSLFLIRYYNSSYIITPEGSFELGLSDVIGNRMAVASINDGILSVKVVNESNAVEWERELKTKAENIVNVTMSRDLNSVIICTLDSNKNKTNIIKISKYLRSPISINVKGKTIGLADLPFSMSVVFTNENKQYLIDWDNGKIIYDTNIDKNIVGITTCFGFGIVAWSDSKLYLLDCAGNIYTEHPIKRTPKFIENPFMPLFFCEGYLYTLRNNKITKIKLPNLGIKNIIDAAYSDGILFLLDEDGRIWCINPLLLEVEDNIHRAVISFKDPKELLSELEKLIEKSPIELNAVVSLVDIHNKICSNDFEYILMSLAYVKDLLKNLNIIGLYEALDSVLDNIDTLISTGKCDKLVQLKSRIQLLLTTVLDEQLLKTVLMLTGGKIYFNYLDKDITVSEFLLRRKTYDLRMLLDICINELERYDKNAIIKILKSLMDVYSNETVLSILVEKVLKENSVGAKKLLLILGYDIENIISKIVKLRNLSNIPKSYMTYVNDRVETISKLVTSGKITNATKLADILLTIIDVALKLRNKLIEFSTLSEIIEIYDVSIQRILESLTDETNVNNILFDIENIFESIKEFNINISKILKDIQMLKIVDRNKVQKLITDKIKICKDWKQLSEITNESRRLVNELRELEVKLEKINNTLEKLNYIPQKLKNELRYVKELLTQAHLDLAVKQINELEMKINKLKDINKRVSGIIITLNNIKLSNDVMKDIYTDVNDVIQTVEHYDLEQALNKVEIIESRLNTLQAVIDRIISMENLLLRLAKYIDENELINKFKENIISKTYWLIKDNVFNFEIIENYERKVRYIISNIDRSYTLLNTCVSFFIKIDNSLGDIISAAIRKCIEDIFVSLSNLTIDKAVNSSEDILNTVSNLCYIKNKSLEITTLLNKLPSRLRSIIETNIKTIISSDLTNPNIDFNVRVNNLINKIDQLKKLSTILEEIRIKYGILESLIDKLKSRLLQSLLGNILNTVNKCVQELRFNEALDILSSTMEIKQTLETFDADLITLERKTSYNILQSCIKNIQIKNIKAIGELLSRIREITSIIPYIHDERELAKLINFIFKEPIIGMALIRLINSLNPKFGKLLTEMMKDISLNYDDDAVKLANIILFLKSLKVPRSTRYDPKLAHLSLITEFRQSESVKEFKGIREKAIKIYEGLKSPEDLEKLVGYTAILCVLGGKCEDLLKRLGADISENITTLITTLAKELNLDIEGLNQLILELVVIPIWNNKLDASRKELSDLISTFNNIFENKKTEILALIREILSYENSKRVLATHLFDIIKQVLEIYKNGIESVAKKFIHVKICGELDPNAWNYVDVVIANTGPFTFVIDKAELHTFTIQKVEFGGLTIVNPNSCVIGKSIARAQNPQERETPALIRLMVKIPSLSSMDPAIVSYEYPIPVKSTMLTEIIDRIRMRYENIEIREIIGVGGNSIVFKVFDSNAKEYRVLKLPSYAVRMFAPTLSNVDRALELIEKLTNLSCPNIARIIKFEFEPFPHVFEEYVEGKSLRELINSGVRFNIKEVLAIIEAIIKAIKCLHKNGLYHNDIRPENIIITPTGAKLIDTGVDEIWSMFKESFGHARSSLRDKIAPCYMHPRLKLSGELLDVFQIGVLMYELITGFSPFCSKDTAEIRPLSSIVIGIPSRLDLLIQKLIDPYSKPSLNLDELLNEIQNLKRELGV